MSATGTISLCVAIFAIVTLLAPSSARAQPAAQGSTVPQGGSLSGHAVSRTPQEINRDENRGIAPGSGAAIEVPNRTTVPKSEYLKAKQRGARGGCKPDAASKTKE